jgi:hypothetical protein
MSEATHLPIKITFDVTVSNFGVKHPTTGKVEHRGSVLRWDVPWPWATLPRVGEHVHFEELVVVVREVEWFVPSMAIQITGAAYPTSCFSSD